MTPAMETLFASVFDYAGLFPPADLGMEEALGRYLAFSGMDPAAGEELAEAAPNLCRFCCPSARLSELRQSLSADRLGAVSVSVIGQSGPWNDAREADARLMNDFQKAGGEVAAYEVRVPDHAKLASYLQDLRGFATVDLYVELPWDERMRESLAMLAESEFAYAKARCGGATVPSAEALAGFLHGCASLDWQFKLTAGLHHVFPTTGQHGLLSVLGGVALFMGEELSRRELQEVLEADQTQWRFGPETIACFEFEANLDDIEAARDLFVSVGTCSIEEPLQELQTLGLVRGD